MSDAVEVRFNPNGAEIRLFGANVVLNPVQLDNLRAALLPEGVETPETPAPKPVKKSTKKG